MYFIFVLFSLAGLAASPAGLEYVFQGDALKQSVVICGLISAGVAYVSSELLNAKKT